MDIFLDILSGTQLDVTMVFSSSSSSHALKCLNPLLRICELERTEGLNPERYGTKFLQGLKVPWAHGLNMIGRARCAELNGCNSDHDHNLCNALGRTSLSTTDHGNRAVVANQHGL